VNRLEDAPFVNIFDPALPEDAFERLRDRTWLVRTPIGGIAIGRAQVQALLSDRRLRSSVLELLRLQGVSEGPVFDAVASSVLAVDGDDHVRLRRLVSPAFTPRAVERRREAMRGRLAPLVDAVAPLGRTEFMADIADRYPIQVMCDLLGVPAEDHRDFARWNQAATWVLSLRLTEHRSEAEEGMARLQEYVRTLIADRRAAPRDDIVTALVQAEEAGDRLNDRELETMIAGLLFAGYDTTRNQLGLAMALFATNPDQWAALRADPALAPAAVEEVMRFSGAVNAVPRVVLEDLELDGYLVKAGTLLMLSTAGANRDPAAFKDPLRFDITVPREPQLTFGGGPHFCLGASLARAEMQEALPVLASAMPDLALDGEPVWRQPFGIFGPDRLPLRFSART
jgi:cytochrome P450